MALMKEALSKEDYDRIEKGLPPIKHERMPRPEPVKPIIDNEITMADVTIEGYTIELESAKKHPLKNEQGIIFIGFDVVINLNLIVKKKGPGRPKEKDESLEPKILEGWMLEGEFLALVRTYRKQIDQQVIHG
jgi:hypothetical protein